MSAGGGTEGSGDGGGRNFSSPRSGAGSEPLIESGPGLLAARRGSGGGGREGDGE